MHTFGRTFLLSAMLAVTSIGVGPASADVATTGTFGIDVDVSFPFTSGTFDGAITGFDSGPFSVGGTPVDLATDIGSMTIPTSPLINIDVGALAVTFDFSATDDGLTANNLDIGGSGVAVCNDAFSCSQGAGTFVGDVTSIVDPDGLLPDGYVYTFDGTVAVSAGPFDADGVFGINGFAPANLPTGVPSQVTSNSTSFFDSRRNTLRDFLIDLTFAEVTSPGTVSFVGKSAVPGSMPASIGFNPDVSVFVEITTGGGAAFTPPVEVCFHYEDSSPEDGVVDGTTVDVNTLYLLHALTLGDPFQDVTTTVGGGVVCGNVDTFSPLVVGVGPPMTTTTTSSTSTSSTSTSSTSSSVTSSTAVSTTTTTSTTSTSTSSTSTSSTSTTSSTTTTLPVAPLGKKLLIKANPKKPAKQSFLLLAKDDIDLGAGPGTEDDPTEAGGSLRLVATAIGGSTGGAFTGTYPLGTPGQWGPLKKKDPTKGYKYKKGDPIKTLIVKAGKLIKIKGKGEALGIDLTNELERVDVELNLGARTYCFSFGGTTSNKQGKKFLAKDAPAATGCPGSGGSPSGAFVD